MKEKKVVSPVCEICPLSDYCGSMKYNDDACHVFIDIAEDITGVSTYDCNTLSDVRDKYYTEFMPAEY